MQEINQWISNKLLCHAASYYTSTLFFIKWPKYQTGYFTIAQWFVISLINYCPHVKSQLSLLVVFVWAGLWNYQESEKDAACVYKSTIINTSKEMMAFSDFPIPKEFANFMHNKKLMEYARLYATELVDDSIICLFYYFTVC